MEKLTYQEEEVLMIIYQLGKGFIKDILEKMEEPRPPYTTVASIVKNIERKGYLSSKRYANSYQYTPMINHEDYKSESMARMVSVYFGNSYKKMVSFFAKEQKISIDELEEIIRLIEKK
ncbi:MAG: BlaI/MecI/CopY family transcriptional regulator [Paludibacter sp.]|jgi:predicted transcriptional regulator|nr:BlaI/MecI/CopY family transcriptional regulator [Paludibacter sp.]